MSGHSHFSTIKRQKEAKDSQKGKIFSRHAKIIQIAIKSGGGADPDTNSKLRFAIEQAKSDNVPKSNIDRILSRASELGDFTEVTYEGYGPSGIMVVLDTATDNKNRTGQEIKNMFEKVGGSLAGPGSLSYNFETKGLIVINKKINPDDQILKIIDMGIDDVNEVADGIEIYLDPASFSSVKEQIISADYEIISSGIIKKPKTLFSINDPQKAKKALEFLTKLEEQEDVQDVFSNLDIPDDLNV